MIIGPLEFLKNWDFTGPSQDRRRFAVRLAVRLSVRAFFGVDPAVCFPEWLAVQLRSRM